MTKELKDFIRKHSSELLATDSLEGEMYKNREKIISLKKLEMDADTEEKKEFLSNFYKLKLSLIEHVGNIMSYYSKSEIEYKGNSYFKFTNKDDGICKYMTILFSDIDFTTEDYMFDIEVRISAHIRDEFKDVYTARQNVYGVSIPVDATMYDPKYEKFLKVQKKGYESVLGDVMELA